MQPILDARTGPRSRVAARVLAVGLAACAVVACEASDEQISRKSQEVLWGADNRVEYRDATAAQKILANSVGLVTKKADLFCNPSYCTLTKVTSSNPLCAAEKFSAQKRDSSANCTAFLIGPRTFASAGHCIGGDDVPQYPSGPFPSTVAPFRCSAASVAFFWKVDDPGETQGNINIDNNHIYHCTRVVEHGGYYGPELGPGTPSNVSQKNDWVVFEVDRDVVATTSDGARTPLPFAKDANPNVGTALTVIGHPLGLPIKVAPGAAVTGNLKEFWDFDFDGDTLAGNSGSPVLDPSGKVAGIHVGGPVDSEVTCLSNLHCPGDPDCVDPTTGKFDYPKATSLARLSRFAALDINGDGKADYVTVAKQGVLWVLTVSIAGLATATIPLGPYVGFNDVVSFALGDFGKDLVQDVAAIVNGVLFYATVSPGGSVGLKLGFTGLSSDYQSLRSGDFDGDGVEDLEAINGSGDADVFYGSPSGLTVGRPMVSMPTGQRDDGKFVFVTGPSELTYPNPTQWFSIDVPSTATDLRIEVFDGANGTGYDRYDVGATSGCFRIYADPATTGVPIAGNLLGSVEASTLPENAWKSIYKNGLDSKAKNTADPNTYSYIVEATFGSCSGTTPALGANSFKVRTTGNMYYPLDFSFWGRDAVGPWAKGTGTFPAKYDTTWNGVFDPFVVPIGSVSTTLKLVDSDADRKDDPNHPGKESVANDIEYSVVDYATGAPVSSSASNTNPSGNYFAAIGDLDVECKNVTVPAGHEFVIWRWNKVLATNMIHVWFDFVAASSKALPPPGSSSAQPPSGWAQASPSVLSAHLPVLLGQLNPCGQPVGSGMQVASLVDLVRILEGKAGPDYGGPPQLREFRAELLAAKLNLVKAAALGEPLGTGKIYGTDLVVGAVVAESDAALSKHCYGVDCDQEKACPTGQSIPPQQGNNLPALIALLPYLQAINSGEVTYKVVSLPTCDQQP